ncbi:MAG: hypothetical protein ACQESG_00815 [Nanobdellota archaeon]
MGFIPGKELQDRLKQANRNVGFVSNVYVLDGLYVKYGSRFEAQAPFEHLCFGACTEPMDAEDRHDFEQNKLIRLFDKQLDVVEPVRTDMTGVVVTKAYDGEVPETEDTLYAGFLALNRLHRLGEYHGDAHSGNVLVGESIRWFDFGTKAPDNISFISNAARDLRNYLMSASELVPTTVLSDWFDAYEGESIKAEMLCQLHGFNQDFIENWIEMGYGDPYMLRDAL